MVRQIELQDWMRGQEKTHPLKLLGIEPYFPEIPPVVGELVDVFVDVEAPDGRMGRAVMRVTVEWGPDAC